MASFMSSYLEDMQEIDELSRNVGVYRSRLENLCQDSYGMADSGAADMLTSNYREMKGALELGRRYSELGRDGIMGPDRGKISDIVSLWEMFSDKADSYASSLFRQWALGAEVIERTGKRGVKEGAGEAKEELAGLAGDYKRISGFVSREVREKNSPSIVVMDEYYDFVNERRSLDERLERAGRDIEQIISGASPGRLGYAEAEIEGLRKGYSSLARKHSCLRGRLVGKRGLFDCAEQLDEAERLGREIRKMSDRPDYGRAEEDARLIDSWMGIYRNAFARISGQEEITPEYVDELCSIELAEASLLERAGGNPSLAKRAGGLRELDSIVRGQLERELSRVEIELDKRGRMYGDELGQPDYMAGGGKRDNLELMLAASYELSRMRKRCGLEIGESERVRKEVERRLMAEDVEEKRDEKLDENRHGPGRRFEERISDFIQGEEKEPRPAQQQRSSDERRIAETLDRFMEIWRMSPGGRVMDIGSINELFRERDSCYATLRRDEGVLPVREIENAIMEIYYENKARIDEFVRENSRGSLDEERIRMAACYRMAMDTWDRGIKGSRWQ